MRPIPAHSESNQIKNADEYVAEILIEPEFVVRKSRQAALPEESE